MLWRDYLDTIEARSCDPFQPLEDLQRDICACKYAIVHAPQVSF
jgi:hypothetical protein